MLALIKSTSPISLTFSKYPVDRLSIILTRAPRSTRARATCEPIKPAPPVTRAISEKDIASGPPPRIQTPFLAYQTAYRYFASLQSWELSLVGEFDSCPEPETDSTRSQAPKPQHRSPLHIHYLHTGCPATLLSLPPWPQDRMQLQSRRVRSNLLQYLSTAHRACRRFQA